MTAIPTPPLRVLFICTENAGRSQIAEALLHHRGRGAFEVASAGSRPASGIHPLTLETLREHGINWSGRFPKGFDAVSRERWDLVISLCDRAQEQCPTFPGDPVYAHWRMPDPARVTGDDSVRRRAFADAVAHLRQRIDFLRLLPFEKLQQTAREWRARTSGEMPAAGP
jgi:protein-tyrosine-phosphatase